MPGNFIFFSVKIGTMNDLLHIPQLIQNECSRSFVIFPMLCRKFYENNECEFDGKMCVCNILLQTVAQIRVDNLCIMIDYRVSLRY